MISIRNEEFIKYENNKSVMRMEIDVDSAEELPEVDYFSGKILYMGSVAWDISTGDLYGFKSTGEWVNQDGGSSDD